MRTRLRAATRVATGAVVLASALGAPFTSVGAQIAPSSIDTARADPCTDASRVMRPRFIMAPYGWMTGISGETGVRDLVADVDISFRQLLSKLRFGAMGGFEVDYGPWLGLVDGVYASVRDDRTRATVVGQADLDMAMKMFIGQAFVGYSFLAAPTVAIDVLAGARLWAIDASLRRTGDLLTAERSRTPTWGDALGGLRVRWKAAERWNVSAVGDAGGGGSKRTGEVATTVGYAVSTRWTLFAAYRYLQLDYRKNEYFFDGHLGGPAIGGAYRW